MRNREHTSIPILEQDPLKPSLECARTAANLLQGGPRVCLLGTSDRIARRRFADEAPRVSYRIVKEQSAARFAPVVSIGPLVRSCHTGIVNSSIIAFVPPLLPRRSRGSGQRRHVANNRVCPSAPIPPRNRLAVPNSAKVFSGVSPLCLACHTLRLRHVSWCQSYPLLFPPNRKLVTRFESSLLGGDSNHCLTGSQVPFGCRMRGSFRP